MVAESRATVAALQAETQRLKDELRRLQEADGELNCFRVAVRKLPFGRMGGDVYTIAVRFDPRMIEYGILSGPTNCGDTSNLSRHIHYLAMELAGKVKSELWKQLVTDRDKW